MFLYTTDLEITRSFYLEKLGLDLVRDQGDCLIFRLISTSFIGFCKRPVTEASKPVIITIVTEQIQSWYESLTSSGVQLESEPIYNPKYGITHFFIKDPNGYLVEIQHFDQPL